MNAGSQSADIARASAGGVLERAFCAQVPHRQRFPVQVQRALALLDRAADGACVSGLSIEQALRTTGDLDAARLDHPASHRTPTEGQ